MRLLQRYRTVFFQHVRSRKKTLAKIAGPAGFAGESPGVCHRPYPVIIFYLRRYLKHVALHMYICSPLCSELYSRLFFVLHLHVHVFDNFICYPVPFAGSHTPESQDWWFHAQRPLRAAHFS